MKIEAPSLRRAICRRDCCEWCGRPSRRLQAHHLWAKGMGGGGCLDVRINLIALCFEDHAAAHDGKLSRKRLLRIVAAREGTTPRAIEAEIHRLRRLPKGSDKLTLERS